MWRGTSDGAGDEAVNEVLCTVKWNGADVKHVRRTTAENVRFRRQSAMFALMTADKPRLRIGRILLFGVLAEVATIVVIVLVLTIHERVIAAGQPQSVIDEFAQRAPAVLGPAAGILFVFIGALLATRPLEQDFRRHGLLVGAVSAVLTVPGLLAGDPAQRPTYLGAIVLKLASGYLGGWFSEQGK